MIPERFDLVVIGGGPAGERAAIQAARAGRHVVLVERGHAVGGNRVHWGTIPSKTLRESALFVYGLSVRRLHGIKVEIPAEITVADFMYRQRLVVHREMELINASLGRYKIEVVHGHARFVDPHTVDVTLNQWGKRRFAADHVIIAVGSRPNRPADVPFDGARVLDAESILQLPRMPRSLIVLGAGVIGIEYAGIFAALGVKVHLIDTRDRLLPYLDREIVGLAEAEMERLEVEISHEDRHATIEVLPGEAPPPPPSEMRPLRAEAKSPARAHVRLVTQKGRELVADALLYCVGRDGNTQDLGLDAIGITPNRYGLLEVNESFQTVHPNVYAVGDVIGYPALASTSMEHGRRAVRHALGLQGPKSKTDLLPIAVYSVPEVSAIGATEEEVREKGIGYVVGRGQYEMNPRGNILGAGGLLKMIFETATERVLGVHIVGEGASELIHIGQAYIQSGLTAREISEAIFNYPTLADLYRHAALTAHLALARRKDLPAPSAGS